MLKIPEYAGQPSIMKEPSDSILRTFRLEKSIIDDLNSFLRTHPEVVSLNHLFNVALKEFANLHKRDKTWLKIEEVQRG